mmetsp:Transcript_34532/g.71276  ORF Transcript_34532/g.71276 Transcript_34532/m.71276 type:complete len:197 (-) Transcript_34532:377-967(-)
MLFVKYYLFSENQTFSENEDSTCATSAWLLQSQRQHNSPQRPRANRTAAALSLSSSLHLHLNRADHGQGASRALPFFPLRQAAAAAAAALAPLHYAAPPPLPQRAAVSLSPGIDAFREPVAPCKRVHLTHASVCISPVQARAAQGEEGEEGEEGSSRRLTHTLPLPPSISDSHLQVVSLTHSFSEETLSHTGCSAQ